MTCRILAYLSHAVQGKFRYFLLTDVSVFISYPSLNETLYLGHEYLIHRLQWQIQRYEEVGVLLGSCPLSCL